MSKKLALALFPCAEHLANISGNKELTSCFHQYLIFLGWEYDLENPEEIMDKAISMIRMKDWGLSPIQWQNMDEVCSRFGF